MSFQFGAMDWTEIASINLPQLDFKDATRIREEIHKLNRGQGLCVRLKSGRQPLNVNSVVMYGYCCTHEACKHVQKHEFTSSEGGVLHSITASGYHEEKARAVRGTCVETRQAASDVTMHTTPLRAYAEAVEKGIDPQSMPSYESLQRPRRKNVRMRTQGSVSGHSTVGAWCDYLRSLQGGKWTVKFDEDGVRALIHPQFVDVVWKSEHFLL